MSFKQLMEIVEQRRDERFVLAVDQGLTRSSHMVLIPAGKQRFTALFLPKVAITQSLAPRHKEVPCSFNYLALLRLLVSCWFCVFQGLHADCISGMQFGLH